MKITMDTVFATIDFEGNEELQKIVDNELHYKLSVRPDGYQFTPSFKNHYWDGYTLFHTVLKDKNIQFPTGLMDQVDDILGNIQNTKNFQYEVIDNRPDQVMLPEELPEEIVLLNEKLGTLTLRDYQYEAVVSTITNQTGVLHLATNAGKSLSAAGIIQQLLPKLEKGERIAFFTHSTAIFNQIHGVLTEALGIRIGKYGSGKKDIQKVTVVMVPTVQAAMKIDPEKGVKLTAKERIVKRMAKEIAPKFLAGINQKMLMKSFVNNFPVKTQTDTELMAEITEVIQSSESDAKIKFKLNNYIAKYKKILETKNHEAFAKHNEAKVFLDSLLVTIYDEAHRIKSDSFYNTALQCSNALIKVGLTGSIDPKDVLLIQRMKAVFGNVIARTSNEFLISEGHSAKPKIVITPAPYVVANGKQMDITYKKDYMTVYDQGIVNNEYRNTLIAKITEMCYNDGEGVLLIVNRIEHGNNLGNLLDTLNVPFTFVTGEQDPEVREKAFTQMKQGTLKVMIATALIDEGVDISGINSLILCASGKSFRQVIQRVGRALRKKMVGENTTTIYDFADSTNTYLSKHSEARLAVYEEEGFEITKI